jgi:hypothetical protein
VREDPSVVLRISQEEEKAQGRLTISNNGTPSGATGRPFEPAEGKGAAASNAGGAGSERGDGRSTGAGTNAAGARGVGSTGWSKGMVTSLPDAKGSASAGGRGRSSESTRAAAPDVAGAGGVEGDGRSGNAGAAESEGVVADGAGVGSWSGVGGRDGGTARGGGREGEAGVAGDGSGSNVYILSNGTCAVFVSWSTSTFWSDFCFRESRNV